VLKLEENNSGSERLIVKRKTFPLLQLFIEYFKHGIYSPFFPLQDAVCFVILTYLVAVLFTFYIQGVLKLEENNSGAKRLIVKVKHSRYSYSLNILNMVYTLRFFFLFKMQFVS